MTIDNILNSGRTGKRQTVYAKTLGKLRKKYEISERRQGVQHITSVRGIVKPAFQMSYEEDTITGGSVGTDITAGDNMMFTYTTKGTGNVVLTISDRSGVVYRETHGTAGSPSASVAAGQHYFYISLDNGSLNTSSTSNKVDTANDKCTFAGKLADGNYVWSVTENGTTVASGSFTLDRGV